jgi:SAM-dependent methyltransferase
MGKWPKQLLELTAEQQIIRDDFMNAHLHAMQSRWYGFVETFNHRYPLKSSKKDIRTLEIGAGIGAHIAYEDISRQEYHANELRPELCRQIQELFPGVTAIAGDCQLGLPYEAGYFDRILAIHVLEHLPNLPAALREIRRVISDYGVFSVVIPCEGGLATYIARNLSAKPHFEKKYPGQKYSWFIKSEHINMPDEIFEELGIFFEIKHSHYYPLLIPSIDLNLFIGVTLIPKKS